MGELIQRLRDDGRALEAEAAAVLEEYARVEEMQDEELARLREQRAQLCVIVRRFKTYHEDGVGQLTHIMSRADVVLAECGDGP